MDLMALMGGGDEADTVLTSTSGDASLSEYLSSQKYILGVDEIILTSATGAVLASTTDDISGNFVDPDGVTFERAKTAVYFSSILRDKSKKNYYTYAAGAITNNSGTQQLIIIRLDLTAAYKVLKNYSGLGSSGEVILARQDPISRKVALVSPLRSDTTSAIQLRDPKDKFVAAFTPVFEGKSMSLRGEDYSGVPVLEVARKINHGNLALIAKIDLAEATGEATPLLKVFVYAGLCILALATLFAMVFARSITRPLYGMRSTLGMVAQGILPEASEDKSGDEFGQMSTKVDEVVKSLKQSADFAQRIGEGKYDTAFKPASENDILGMSLINMRNNLIEMNDAIKNETGSFAAWQRSAKYYACMIPSIRWERMLSNSFWIRSVPYREPFTL